MSQETILVTGANGYVGLHVLHHGLSKGWTVVAAVRTEKAANRIRSIFPEPAAAASLKVALIEDITTPSYFKPLFDSNNITVVINAASPLLNNPIDVRTQVLDPAISSATAILEAAASYGRDSVRRIVHVSSCTAVLDPNLGDAPGKTYTSADWNPMTYEQAAEGGQQLAYMASKALAERSAWAWMEKHQEAPFDFVSVAPAGVFGPHYLGALEGKEHIDLGRLNLSSQVLWALVAPESGMTPYNDYHLGCWTAVRDVAAALIAAVETPGASGQRILCAQRCHWQIVRDVARRVLPELASRIDPGDPELVEKAKDTTYDMDGRKVSDVLGVEYTSIEVAVYESYVHMLEAEKGSIATAT